MEKDSNSKSGRRKFLSSLATGAASISLASASISSLKAKTESQATSDLEAWFDNINGKHKMVFDSISANDGYAIVWAYTFMTTNNKTGFPDGDLSAMVVFRNKAIPLAMEDRIWKKYKFGKFFKIIDWATNSNAERNLYWNPKEGEMPEPGMSIKELQARGVMFCVCETAMNLNTKQLAKSMALDYEEVRKDWISGLLPGVKIVPSGVLALNRAQEHGASYCYAG